MISASDEAAGAEDSDDSSSTSTSRSTYSLKQFREQWQNELHATDHYSTESTNATNDKQQQNQNPNVDQLENVDDECKAKLLFQQGAELEKLGKCFEAMRFYRQAIQIVPDIESKIYETTAKLTAESTTNSTTTDTKKPEEIKENTINDDDDDAISLINVDLMERFQCSLQKSDRLFEKDSNNLGLITTTTTTTTTTAGNSKTHISDLPIEIILYILRWVVSTDMDLRSLDQCSMVSKGFYICARDPDIWRLACSKIWGINVGSLNGLMFASWRQMFLERQRVLFNGCYISKTDYLRYGENSFQDQFYRPVQIIEYYRYMRFFPDGHITMMTSTDEPAQGVYKLKPKHPTKKEILIGHYRLHGDMVIMVLKRNRPTTTQAKSTRRGGGQLIEDGSNFTFYVELKIINSPKRYSNQLQWKHYSAIQQKCKDEITTDFELTPSKYPSLNFSRVKSYHLVSEYPLQ